MHGSLVSSSLIRERADTSVTFHCVTFGGTHFLFVIFSAYTPKHKKKELKVKGTTEKPGSPARQLATAGALLSFWPLTSVCYLGLVLGVVQAIPLGVLLEEGWASSI